LHETEIAKHAEQFGPFAFELDTDAARRLGAMPVIYIPQPVGHDRSRYFDELGLQVIEHLSEIQQVLEFLAYLERTACGTHSGQWIVQRAPDRPRVELEAGVLNDLILNLRNHIQFTDLAGTIKGIASLFYQTDNDYALRPQLEYYRQREWRIVSDLVGDVGRNSRPLTDVEATEVVKANPKFFNGIVPWTNGHHRRIELCQVLQLQPRAWPMLVRRILVPRHLLREVRSMSSVTQLQTLVQATPEIKVKRLVNPKKKVPELDKLGV
jgi:hypothetical protein